jgi:hypothetical protein
MLISFIALLCLQHCCYVAAMRIASYNLRFDSHPDNITVQQTIDSLRDPLRQPTFLEITTEQPWSTRRVRVAEHILSNGIAIVGGYGSN